MTDHDALLAAICANPREDTPRLVFADWLEENGQPERAAFIRTDIAMFHCDEWDAERLRWEALLTWKPVAGQSWKSEWLPTVDALVWHWNGVPITRRGFPWSIHVEDLGRFRERAAELFACHPLEYLAFRANLPQLNRFVCEPWFPRVTGLEWQTGRYSAQSLGPLLEASNASLTELTARALSLTPDGLRAVFESRLFPNLARLRLTGNGPQIGRAALESLAHVPAGVCRLRSLILRGDGLNRDAQFLACHLPESLRVLDIAQSRINSDGAREFAGVKAASCLRMLTLASNHVGNAGGIALFTSPHLAGLKVLDLSYCQVGDEALRALLDDSPLADGLNLLNLTGSPASGDMKQAVKDRMGDRVRL
jgi:uncharacterized protein (TIGR02996 family)